MMYRIEIDIEEMISEFRRRLPDFNAVEYEGSEEDMITYVSDLVADAAYDAFYSNAGEVTDVEGGSTD